MHQVDATLTEYLSHIEMENHYKAHFIPCEVCGETKFTVIREVIDIGKGAFGKYPVVACDRCGFLYQNPRFDLAFYQEYYSRHYRKVIYGNPEPDPAFIQDQLNRGRTLYASLKKYLPERGNLLDVGSSVGGMMVAFMENGWSAYGTDPDSGFVRYGRDKMKLPVEEMAAEAMKLETKHYDLIMIMGSLEHVYDPNKVLEICRAATRENGLLLLEGRGNPQSVSKKYFNHNHHRYLTMVSMQLLMRKHGWTPLYTTDEPLSGPTRPGGIFCLGRAGKIPSQKEFLNIIDSELKESPKEILHKFDELDRLKG